MMDIIQQAMEFAREIFSGDSGGHDFDHTLRVFHMATRIAKEEKADLQTVQLAALLHDVDDKKLSPETYENLSRAADFLHRHGIEETKTAEILQIIRSISFSANAGKPATIEGMCVQDADRLDAMGAIGIARAFAYGGSRGRRMHDPDGMDRETTLCHFYDKLLRLESLMNTKTGRSLARQRHAYMQEFLNTFYAEWEGKC